LGARKKVTPDTVLPHGAWANVLVSRERDVLVYSSVSYSRGRVLACFQHGALSKVTFFCCIRRGLGARCE
jgi:hypothetical protein